ncbi:MAG: GTPase ObgE [Clostridia bacterium]|nr:GTPase ObgE [Clostridia bacterium]
MFIDVAKIKVKAGNGGDGAVSFHREKYIANGGPDGGDGGKGGDVIFKADSNLTTLADFKYKRKYVAENGQNGKPSHASGKSAPDLVIRVPKGTLVKDAESGKILADISTAEEVTIAKGGKGGLGNMHFATAARQAPRFAKPGEVGEEIELQLELKLLADVGIVGFPNVGKSTLLSCVSSAKPIIADYHFTTLIPVLGVIKHKGEAFVMADIPGLIEGAQKGLGLGHQFLRHVERCRLLVHIIDISGREGRDPKEDFQIINNEIRAFNQDLASLPMIVVGNKCDLANAEKIEDFRKYITGLGYRFFPIVASSKRGVDELLDAISEILSELPAIKVFNPKADFHDTTRKGNDKSFEIKNENGKFIIASNWLERLIESINFDNYESLQYFQKVLSSSGINDALIKNGVKNGDTVKIKDFEFDFIE